MRKRLTIFTLSIFVYQASMAQFEADNWIFSYEHRVCFNHATNPDTLAYPPGFFMYPSGPTSYSDKNGNLLFFGDGWGLLYDRKYQVFPSLHPITGTPLYGCVPYGYLTQPLLGVPYPGHDSLYIVFQIYCDYGNQYHSQLYYSVVNMNLRNGLGEVDPSQKNIPLLGSVDVGFKLTAILHCNKRDIWVIGHLNNSSQYYSILVTQNGVSASPVFFPGNFIPSPSPEHPNNTGCLKVSASGTRLAAAYHSLDFVELLDFNNQTGIATNLLTLTAHPPPQDTSYNPLHWADYGPVGVDFSSSGNKLYVTGNYDLQNFIGQPFYAFIYQFDVSLPSVSQIQNSQYRVDSIESAYSGAIQIGNNGKMYVSTGGTLSEVANPENPGIACNYTRYVVYSGSSYANVNLPVFLQSYFQYPVIATGNCHFQNISFSIQNVAGVSNILWDFGDPSTGINNSSTSFTPTHIFSQQGYFLVKAILYNANGCGADTVRKQVYAGEFQVFLGNDTTICEGDSLRLHMHIPNASNLWSNSSADTVMKVTQPGTYWVHVSLGECSASDTIHVTVRSLPAFTLGNDTTICGSQPYSLSPNPDPSNVTYLWNTGATTSFINTTVAGQYWLKIKETVYSCEYRDTINIQFKTLPNFNLGNDTALCQKDTLILNAFVNGATGYSWNTGDTLSSIKSFQTGVYWADVAKDGCTYRDSISILFKPLPTVNLGNDTTICEDQSLQLDAQNAGSQYLWQDNSSSKTYLVIRKGNYWVKVTTTGCSSSDTMFVNYDLKPVFTLGKDTVICDGQTIMLQPKIQNSSGISWLWDNGSTNVNYNATQIGHYILQAANYCGGKSDTITISKGVCKLYIPSAFTPNNDGLNDLFKPKFGENIIQYSMEIYNRWGQKIFISANINKGWDGKLSGILQPNGNYVWIIRYKALNDPKEYLLKGTVLLIR